MTAWRALPSHALPRCLMRRGRDPPGGFTMCDYSLEHLASRPAMVGDHLVTTKFSGMYTTGFCAVGEPSLAVCIKPGTELAFEREIEGEALLFKRGLGSQVARFRRVNEDRKFVHHDALELPSGKSSCSHAFKWANAPRSCSCRWRSGRQNVVLPKSLNPRFHNHRV